MPTGPDGWGGRRAQQARDYMRTLLPADCVTCHRRIEVGDERWVVHHVIGRGEAMASGRPWLVWDVNNWAHQCRTCSDRSGQEGVIAKARAEGARGVGSERGSDLGKRRFFGGPTPAGERRHFPSLPPEQTITPLFDPKSLEGVPWLSDLMAKPDDSNWPRFMSPVHPDAVGSYGQDVEDWLRETQGVEWRWWLKLATRRQLEFDKHGRLVWRTILDSAPRRAGKSTRQRGVATWRMEHGQELFHEVQTVMHTGSDMGVCREVQRLMWRWAEDVAGWTVTRSNGKESVETPAFDRWLIRSQTGVYSYQATLGMVDEAWDVDPVTVDDGLEPSLMDGRVRFSHQLWMASTAHRRAKATMRRRIDTAIARMGEDWKTLLMLWGCAPDADIGDPEVWRLSSPYWDEDRLEMVSDRYERAMAGEADPEADDPDPLAGFASQYCNKWPAPTARRATGEPVVTETEWSNLNGYEPGTPMVAAVESWFAEGAALAKAELLADGHVGVSSVTYPDVTSAVQDAQSCGAPTVLVGKSLTNGLVGVESAQGTTRQAVVDLRRFIDDDLLRHDGSPALTEQVLELRAVKGTDGPRLTSKTRADVVKAAAWAVDRARKIVESPLIR